MNHHLSASEPVSDPILLNDWHVVAKLCDLALNGVVSARLLGRDLVVWRNADGVHAWLDLCIHRGAQLSLGKVQSECLVCPYHGWTYDSSGGCTRIPAHPGQKPPARARAEVFHARVGYDLIWVCLGEPSGDIPPFPDWNAPSVRTVLTGPYTFRAAGPRVVENFLDVGHLAFVHEGMLGDPAFPEIADYEVETLSDSLIARDIPIWQPNPDGSAKGAKMNYTYQALRPLTAAFSKNHLDRRYAMIYPVTPVDFGVSKSWGVICLNYDPEPSLEQFIAFQNSVAQQDIPIVESQHPELLPLDLQAELHLRSDRMSIAYRQWLKRLGLSFGTA